MALFGNKEEKVAQEVAGEAEVSRLTGLSAEDLAVELMPAFGPDGARSKGREGTPPMQIVQWLMSDYPRHPSLRPLVDSVLAALSSLERGGLLRGSASGIGTGAQRYALTPIGEEALADGSVRQCLGSG
jgi:hypothetical protein